MPLLSITCTLLRSLGVGRFTIPKYWRKIEVKKLNVTIMAEIIPAIISKSYAELEEKTMLVATSVNTVQLDIMDGIFVNNKTWSSPEDLQKIKTSVLFEVHIMVTKPLTVLNRWLKSPRVSRIILHWESDDVKNNIASLSAKIRGDEKKFGLALNPDTPLTILDNYISQLDLVLLMGAYPGFAGQTMKLEVIPKIMALRRKYPKINIEVDCGVKLGNIKKLVQAGANFLVMGSEIFTNPNPQEVIKEANELIGEKYNLLK